METRTAKGCKGGLLEYEKGLMRPTLAMFFCLMMTNETHFSFLNGASLTKDMYHRWPQIYHRLESQSLNEIRP